MSWNIFRNKNLKALDKIYSTYDNLYRDYRKFADVDNELLNAQATIIRGQLHQLGAAFDHVISAAGPEYLDKCFAEYGYIPYTALTKIVKSPLKDSDGLSYKGNLLRISNLVKRLVLLNPTSKLHTLTTKSALKTLIAQHSDMYQEGIDLKLFTGEEKVFDEQFKAQLLELYFFPRNKATSKDKLHWDMKKMTKLIVD